MWHLYIYTPGFWVEGRFGLSVGTSDVASQAAVIPSLPSYIVGHAADGWLQLAHAIINAKKTTPPS